MTTPTPGDARPFDPGAQAQRTVLAWNRTALAVMGNGLLALRAGAMSGSSSMGMLAALLMLSGVAMLAYGRHRGRELLDRALLSAPSSAAIGATAWAAVLACGLGVASCVLLATL